MGKDDVYEYTVNFDRIMKIFEGAAKDMLNANPISKRTVTYTFNIDGSDALLSKDGKPRDKAGKLSKAQRAALGRMHEPFVKKWLAKAEAETQAACDTFLKENAFSYGGKHVWLNGTSSAAKKKAIDALNQEVADIRKHYAGKIQEKIEADLKSYRAGRVRNRKIVGQGIKHTVKPVVQVASAPLGILTTPPPLVPVSIVLTLKGLVLEGKDTLDFFNAKYRSMKRLEASIDKHLATFMERATDAKTKVGQKAKLLPRNEPKQIDDDKVIRREIEAIAMMDLFHTHKRSVANLELLMGKYQKCMDKSRYAVLKLVKKIEKAEENVARLKKSEADFVAYSAKLDHTIKTLRSKIKANATLELQRALAKSLKDLAGHKAKLKDVRANIRELEGQVKTMKTKANKLFEKFMKRELAFHQYKKDLKRLNRAMPSKLGAYKTILEMALAVLHMAELGLSVAGDTMSSMNLLQATAINPNDVKELSDILTKCAMSSGYSETVFDQLGDILNGGGDIEALTAKANA